MTTTRPAPSLSTLARRAAALCAIAALAAGCATRTPAPVSERAPLPPARPAAASAPPPASTPPAAQAPASEPDWRPPTYTVKRGDTLYQIALEHGLDYRDLAAWNGIENLNVIRVGQSLRLTAPGSEAAPGAMQAAAGAAGTTTAPLRTTPPVGVAAPPSAASPAAPPAASPRVAEGTNKTSPKAVKEPWSEQAMRDVARNGGGIDAPVVASAEPAPRTATAPPAAVPAAPPSATAPAATAPSAAPSTAPGVSPGDDEGLDWVWPAKGKVVAGFSEAATLKGIDIAGASGDPVVASAPGKVVYAGTGLRGYGKLVIVKHNATYLTAYAHNREILVKEGQSVTRGQKIAEMGSTDADRVKLHFEIRRLGKPMDPLRYLPPA